MTAPQKPTSDPRPSEQAKVSTETKQAAAQVPPTRATGPESATGAALAAAKHEIPSGDDRGSKTPVAGDPQPDQTREATGAQTTPARFTSNGQLPHNTVPSPTGSVPVGLVATSVEDAKDRVEATMREHDAAVAARKTNRRLDTATINRLTGAELRAIGEQRGYVMSAYAGTRTMRALFTAAQDKDPNIEKPSAPKA